MTVDAGTSSMRPATAAAPQTRRISPPTTRASKAPPAAAPARPRSNPPGRRDRRCQHSRHQPIRQRTAKYLHHLVRRRSVTVATAPNVAGTRYDALRRSHAHPLRRATAPEALLRLSPRRRAAAAIPPQQQRQPRPPARPSPPQNARQPIPRSPIPAAATSPSSPQSIRAPGRQQPNADGREAGATSFWIKVGGASLQSLTVDDLAADNNGTIVLGNNATDATMVVQTQGGGQQYGNPGQSNPLTLGAGVTLTDSGSGTITFASTIDGCIFDDGQHQWRGVLRRRRGRQHAAKQPRRRLHRHGTDPPQYHGRSGPRDSSRTPGR